MQQINLYIDELRPKKEWLTLTHLLLVVVILVVVLALSTIGLRSGMSKWNEKLSSKKIEKERIVLHLQKLETQVKGLKVDTSLENLDNRLERRIKINQELVSMIDSAVQIKEGVFSKLMMALARQYIPGISLSYFEFDLAGQEITLSGETQAAEKIPEFLQHLRNEPLFVGRTFRTFQVGRKKVKGKLAFKLSTMAMSKLLISDHPIRGGRQ